MILQYVLPTTLKITVRSEWNNIGNGFGNTEQ